MDVIESRVDPSRTIDRDNLKAFAREFESAISILEGRYLDQTDSHSLKMLTCIKTMQDLRNGWRDAEFQPPTEQQLFNALSETCLDLLPEVKTEKGRELAVELYLLLGRMRTILGSTWLAAGIYDLCNKFLHEIRD